MAAQWQQTKPIRDFMTQQQRMMQAQMVQHQPNVQAQQMNMQNQADSVAGQPVNMQSQQVSMSGQQMPAQVVVIDKISLGLRIKADVKTQIIRSSSIKHSFVRCV